MAVTFSGGSDKIEMGVAAAARLNLSAGTFALWVCTSSESGIQSIVDLRLGGTEAEITDFHGAFGISLRASFQGVAVSTTSLSIPEGWVHLASTWDKTADQFKFFKNGSQLGTTQTGLGTLSGSYSLFALGNNPFSEGWNGGQAEFGAWTVALPPEQIALLASGILPPMVRPDALAVYYPLNGIGDPLNQSPATSIVGTRPGAHPPKAIRSEYPSRGGVAVMI